ncbi:hypothetical protein Bbelb_270340 [Branchiostoma belcheri]|nr:hypothetical protein Bbelb_270340 [Branchiostoma belcheri]
MCHTPSRTACVRTISKSCGRKIVASQDLYGHLWQGHTEENYQLLEGVKASCLKPFFQLCGVVWRSGRVLDSEPEVPADQLVSPPCDGRLNCSSSDTPSTPHPELVLSAVGIPTNIGWLWEDSVWPEGQVSCVLLDALFEAANFASVLNVVCVSAEVYVLICRPHIAKVWVNEIHAKMAVAAVWFVCVSSSVGVTLCIRQYWESEDGNITSVSHAGMSQGIHDRQNVTSPAAADSLAPRPATPHTACLKTLPFYTDKFNLISIAGLYVSLLVLLAVLYGAMFTRLRNTTGKMAKQQAALRKKCESMTSITAAHEDTADGGQQDSSADQPDSFTPSRPVSMLGTVVAIVCLSRMFYYVICILATVAPRMLRSVGEYVAMATRVVFYLSGVLVPAVYAGMSVQFRRGLKRTGKRLVLCRWRERTRRRARVLKGRLPPTAAASNQTVDTAGYNTEDDDFDMD